MKMNQQTSPLDFQIFSDLQQVDQPVVVYEALQTVFAKLQTLTIDKDDLQSVTELIGELQPEYLELATSEQGKFITTAIELDFGQAILSLATYIESANDGEFDETLAQVIEAFQKLYEKTQKTLNIAVDTSYEFEEEVLKLLKDLNVFYVGETTTIKTYESMLRMSYAAVFIFRHEEPYLKTNIDQLVMLAKAIEAKRSVIVIELGNQYLEDRQISRDYEHGYDAGTMTVFSGKEAWNDFFKWATHVDEPQTDDQPVDTDEAQTDASNG